MKPKPLDVLATEAGFRQSRKGLKRIGINGNAIDHYFTGYRTNFYALTQNEQDRLEHECVNFECMRGPDLEILSFNDPQNAETARIYVIAKKELCRIVKTNRLVHLDRKKPRYAGQEAFKALRQYILKVKLTERKGKHQDRTIRDEQYRNRERVQHGMQTSTM